MDKDAGGRGWGTSAATIDHLQKALFTAYLPAKDSAALAAKAFDLFGMESITFISCQSYGNSLPQPRQATYVPVSCAAGESRWPGRLVIGKLKFLWLQPKRTSSRLAIIHHPQTTGLPWIALTCRLRQHCTTGHVPMYTLVHVSPYCYIRFGVAEKGSLSKEHKFSLPDHVINTRIQRKLMKMNGIFFK